MMVKTALLLSPHTDDVELAMGGTINKLTRKGWDVFIATFCVETEQHPSEFLLEEQSNALHLLGVRKENIFHYDFPIRRFSEVRQDILEVCFKLKEDIEPLMVYSPSKHDCHQDHEVIHRESIRAFKRDCSIFSYHCDWNHLNKDYDYFEVLMYVDMVQKALAIMQYKSQINKNYANTDYWYSLAKTLGVNINVEFAEVFDIVRLIHV